MIGPWRSHRRKTAIEVVLHPSTTDCGIASLKMILGAFGVPATLAEVRASTRYTSSAARLPYSIDNTACF